MKLLDTPAFAAFRGLSRLRGKRIFHPDGIGLNGVLKIPRTEASPFSFGVFGGPGTHPAVVRLSRGAGLPAPLPDVLGLALRVSDAYGPGLHQDLLLVSSDPSRLLRFAILPGPHGFFSSFFSSVAPFGTPEGSFVLAARCTDRGPSPATAQDAAGVAQGRSFEILAARIGGRWLRVGELKLGRRLADSDVEQLRFNPWNTSAEVRPRGPFMRLRDPAYRGSQAGRAAG